MQGGNTEWQETKQVLVRCKHRFGCARFSPTPRSRMSEGPTPPRFRFRNLAFSSEPVLSLRTLGRDCSPGSFSPPTARQSVRRICPRWNTSGLELGPRHSHIGVASIGYAPVEPKSDSSESGALGTANGGCPAVCHREKHLALDADGMHQGWTCLGQTPARRCPRRSN